MTSLAIVTIMLTMCSCGSDSTQKAQELLEKISSEYEGGKYEDALSDIDSLRKKFPEAIEQRKEALKLYQDAALKMAQGDLMRIDSALQVTKSGYEKLKAEVEAHKEAGLATAEELTRLTLTKMKVDSLQNKFDAYVSRVKFIHKKQAED